MEEPDTTRAEKHFLDTSVARPMLVGTRQYKAYFADEFGNNPCYINKYVQMEFKRSYLCNVIAFYFILHLDTLETIGDALRGCVKSVSIKAKQKPSFSGDIIKWLVY